LLVRNISGAASDTATMHDEGCADAQASSGPGPYVTLLHIGAQTIHAPLSAANPGVALSGFGENSTPRLSYAQLVSAVDGYLDGYVECRTGSAAVTVAVGTNNDGDFTTYTAADKGKDWAGQVIEPARSHVSADSWLNVVGADDIEAGFASTELQAEQWETAYRANTSAELVETGSADNCPIAFDPILSTNCGAVRDDNGLSKTWSQADYARLAHRLNPSRIVALPQIYYPTQAWQWAEIALASATSTDHITFIGVLTEHAADTSQYTSQQAWGALWDALSASGQITLPAPPMATDLLGLSLIRALGVSAP